MISMHVSFAPTHMCRCICIDFERNAVESDSTSCNEKINFEIGVDRAERYIRLDFLAKAFKNSYLKVNTIKTLMKLKH